MAPLEVIFNPRLPVASEPFGDWTDFRFVVVVNPGGAGGTVCCADNVPQIASSKANVINPMGFANNERCRDLQLPDRFKNKLFRVVHKKRRGAGSSQIAPRQFRF